jgi:hypothetical protein
VIDFSFFAFFQEEPGMKKRFSFLGVFGVIELILTIHLHAGERSVASLGTPSPGLSSNQGVMTDGLFAKPLLGYLHDREGQGIRAVFGIPGAARWAESLAYPGKFERIWFSPAQDAVVVVRETPEGRRCSYLNLRHNPAEEWGLEENFPMPLNLAFSPQGLAFAISGSVPAAVRVYQGTPPGWTCWESRLPGHAPVGTALSVSDDGQSVLLSLVEADRTSVVWIIQGEAARWIGGFEEVTAIRHLANNWQALIADRKANALYWFTPENGMPRIVPLPGFDGILASPVDLEITRDQQRLLVLNSSSPFLSVLNLANYTHSQIVLPAGCSRFKKLASQDFFALSDYKEKPVFGIDASGTEPRLVFIPALPNQQEGRESVQVHNPSIRGNRGEQRK